MKLCTNTRKFIHPHNSEIIEMLIPNTVKDWHKDDGAINIIEGLVTLICEVQDVTICGAQLETLIKKIISPLVENIDWIKSQEKQKGSQLTEKDINQYVLDTTVMYLDFIGEFCKSY